jgi:hypothetical protein
VKYACPNRPTCTSKRLLVSEINELLWNALVQLFLKPESVNSLLAPSSDNDLESLKKQLATLEKEDKANKDKLDRLLNLYLEGNIPQANYVVKSSEIENDTERLSQSKTDLQRRIQNHGKQDARAELIQNIRLLSRSHRRFTVEQKVKVFRSLVKETRITTSGVEFEMYVQPTQNVWWKYRQKRTAKNGQPPNQTVRVGIPQSALPAAIFYTTGEVARMLGISTDAFRKRISAGKYALPPRNDGNQRIFTNDYIRQLRGARHR